MYYHLDDTPNGARYHAVTIIEHPQVTTTNFGGLTPLSPLSMEWGEPSQTQLLNPLIYSYSYSYTPAYTEYQINESYYPLPDNYVTHNYWGGTDQGEGAPGTVSPPATNVSSYYWTITGDAAAFLSFSDEEGSNVTISTDTNPTLYYSTQNTTGTKTATLTLVVTYEDNAEQTSTTTVTVITPCQNPPRAGSPEITYTGVTVSWYPTADTYTVLWQKDGASTWNSVDVGNATSYTFTGLDFATTYNYKVKATSCSTGEPTPESFTTLDEPDGLVLFGAVFGGGRMANVGGKTEVVIINCDSIRAVYGGNDIAGKVLDTIPANHTAGYAGSNIVLGVAASDAYATAYNNNQPSTKVRVVDVYGGGNGYYAYNGSSFVDAATTGAGTVPAGVSVMAQSRTGEWSVPVWTNSSTTDSTLIIPTITTTSITVTNDPVKVDSIFGGAKNAFLLCAATDSSSIKIDGGTVFAVFGGNNYGGNQQDGKHHIEVNATKTNFTPNVASTETTGYGRDFGIRYLFGGGNKVEGLKTDIIVRGGQCDTIFGGGNSADVAEANIKVKCPIASGSGSTYGNVYSNAISGYSTETGITINNSYHWNGTGVYNVRTLFGGNNQATMRNCVPNIILTSGSVGTVYGGGNAGDMAKQQSGGSITFPDEELDDFEFDYSTYVTMNSSTILVDYLYGGCQMSNVKYSTWVELKKGHVGTVYGGCNISGDVGSHRVHEPPYGPSGGSNYPTTEEEQEVYGGTYVKAGGADDDNIIVYNNLFAGSNGYYNCSQDGIHYNDVVLYADPNVHEGMEVPTHNETHAIISKGATINGNVYAGGNLACVGFDDGTGFYREFIELVGLASLRMDGGHVIGNVYGGGNMASIYGINEVRVSGGQIDLALYGGNDCSGQVAEKTNRILPDDYTIASDGATSLTALGVKTYVGVKGSPQIGTVYGGGNGAYNPDDVQYCYSNFEPIQSYTFVDIHINGSNGGITPGHIGTVYGGGNGVTVRHGVTVFFNIQNEDENDGKHVDTIFGGNNKGNLDVVSNIILLHGKVGTVYGGCNKGAMIAQGNNTKTFTTDFVTYNNIGSYVRLLASYPGVDANHQPITVIPDAKVTEAIYGGCRMNGVRGNTTYPTNSLVLVEGGDFSDMTRGIFGGSDISGHVSGKSQVAVTGGTVGNVYGGGNGGYYYGDYNPTTDTYNVYMNQGDTEPLATGVGGAPSCNYSGVDIWSGQVGADANHTGKVFGGGFGQLTSTDKDVEVNIGVSDAVEADPKPLIYGEIYGGSALGNVNFNSTHSTTVNFLNGKLVGSLYGGGLGYKDGDHPENNVEAKVRGKVFVNISSSTQDAEHCFIDLRNAKVYGCNNTNGSPQDDVEVHVYKTGFTTGDYNSQTGNAYAIDEVFGGGNQADYRPAAVGSGETPHKTLVFVHDCLNTIRRVFSGGNAADASKVAATIDGGRFNYVFGGGNGEVTAANIGDGGTDLLVKGGKINHLFGGSNKNGSISGTINTVVNNESGCAEEISEFFGGSNEAVLGEIGHPATVKAIIACGAGTFDEIYGGSNLADIIGDVILTVRGGTCINVNKGVFGGSKGQAGDDDDDAADITGNVTLNLEGGNIYNAFGGSNINGNITGNIVVNVIDVEGTCGLDLYNVYGGGNVTAYTPTSSTAISPVVNVIHIAHEQGIKGNVFGGAKGSTATVSANPQVNFGYNAATMTIPVDYLPEGYILPDPPRAYVTGSAFGGGDAAQVAGNTEVNVYNGVIVHKLVGGGNSLGVTGDVVNVGVTGNVVVNISGGNVCTATDGLAGVYGGCNESGVVNGNITLNITGSEASPTTIGTLEALQAHKTVNVHGGGYGAQTATKGNVTIHFGTDDGGGSSEHCDYPMLYGDMYGGSALGQVNDPAANPLNTTTVNILNGSVIPYMDGTTQYGGNIFGGGLGEVGDVNKGQVNGEVHVNIGSGTGSDIRGKASLKLCNVYGCNNTNGSPKKGVYVDVYQTAHEANDLVTSPGGNDPTHYAIRRVYGGGNQADYVPDNHPENALIAHNTIHNCENTIERVYGGGNAANTFGAEVKVDGGRFNYIFGGGNGQVVPASIGEAGVRISIYGGHVGWYFNGCDMGGTVGGPIIEQYGCPDGITCPCEGDLVVDKYYFGANKALTLGGLSHIINCGDNMNFKYVFGGSRLAVVYGDIKLWVRGGTIENLFAGNEGSDEVQADVKKYPADNYNWYTNPDGHPDEVKEYLIANSPDGDPHHSALCGTGGNLLLVLQGGTLGNVYGGNDFRGNVEGNITIIVDSIQDAPCQLDIDYLYGGNNHAGYTPDSLNHHVHLDPNRISPQVYIKRGHVNFDVYGGSHGGAPDHQFGNGIVVSNPQVVIGDSDPNNPHKVRVGRDIFGGGNEAELEGNPVVVVQGKTTVGGNVYGGGKVGSITGSTDVAIAPTTSFPQPETPTPPSYVLNIQTDGTGTGTVLVIYNQDNQPVTVYDGDSVPAGTILSIMATPGSGSSFDHWWTNYGDIDPGQIHELITTCKMGSQDTILKATFNTNSGSGN